MVGVFSDTDFVESVLGLSLYARGSVDELLVEVLTTD